MMPQLSLLRQGNPLSSSAEQNRLLDQSQVIPFERSLERCGLWPLVSLEIEVLQLNLGKLCNQTCSHCHVDAGPDRREVMSRETLEACLRFLKESSIPVLDITGGAPEMNPHFRWIVSEAIALGRRVIDRCNLTILTTTGYEDLGAFLADHRVEIVASLPCYLAENADRQRGEGVFARSIRALQHLNKLGYGRTKDLPLTLVFNPGGASLPPDQEKLEADYRRELKQRYDIDFTQLLTITNMPISRFLEGLLNSGEFENYMEMLVCAFNPGTAEKIMCRTTLSVGWDGKLSDCDFNQMLDLGLSSPLPQRINDASVADLTGRRIVTGQHCYGCTAGNGSSCQGALTGH